MVLVFKDLLKNVVVGFGVLLQSMVYDFDFGQWGLCCQVGESFDVYFDWVMVLYFGKNDFNVVYDFSLDGLVEFNQFIGCSIYIIYVLWVMSVISKGLVIGWVYFMLVMFVFFFVFVWFYFWLMCQIIGNMMGSLLLGKVQYDVFWWENDGLVLVKSQGVLLGQSEVVYVGGFVQLGQWYDFGKFSGWDYIVIVGIFGLQDVCFFYCNQVVWLVSLL